jgi:superfamily II RNA helicase
MQDVLTEGKSLLGAPQQREVDTAIGDLIRESPTVAESVLNQSVFEALRLGIGLHHAGILPSVKRLIEVLFERGLCKAVFATETMSLGIHMPARSVVLQGLTKRTDRGFRSLTHNELTQMAGRAGRRGIDPEGTCVVALDARDGLDDLLRVIDGSPEPIESQFKLGYGSVALLLSTGAPPEALRRRVESSFGQYQNLKRIREVEADVRALEGSLEELRRYPAPCGDFQRIGRYRRARQEVEARRHALGRGGGKRGERTVAEAEPGRLVLVRRGGAATLAMVLGIHAIRGDRVLIDALLPHGVTVRIKSGVIKRVFWATPALHVPRDRGPDGRDRGRERARGWRERDDRGRDGRGADGRGLRHLADELERLSVAELIDRERAQGPEAALAAIECHRCPWGATPRCDREWRQLETVTERLGIRRRQLEALRGAYWQEFLRVMEVLEQFGAVRDRQVEAKGRLVAGIRHDNELLVAEAVAHGVFTDVSGPEAAAICSALIEEARSGDPALARTFLKKRPKLKRKLDQLMRAADTVHEAQRARHLRIPIAVHAGFMPAVFRWASGEDDWSGIVEEAFGGHEGDLIRAMRRLIDLLRQLADSPEVAPETARVLAHASRVIDRGIVLESALI